MEFKVRRTTIIYYLSLLIFFNIIWIAFIIFTIFQGLGSFKFFILILLIVPFVFLLLALKYPYKIIFESDNLIFKSMLKENKVKISSINKIFSDLTGNTLYFRYLNNFNKQKTLAIFNRINDGYLLLYKIKKENSSIEVLGC